MAALLIGGCVRNAHTPTPATRQAFITGTYVTFEKSRFCITWDTLIVTRDHSQPNLFMVNRESAYQWNLETTYFPVDEVSTYWAGVFDDSSHTLSGVHGLDLRFSPDQTTLRLSGALYWRVE